MRLISWNVNGIRACCDKGFRDSFKALDADFFCLQETKMQEGQLDLSFEGYTSYWNYAEKKGYSGTAIFTRHQPLNVTYGIGIDEHDHEGRVITLEMENFFLVTVYTPNSQDGLKRLDYRMTWEDDFRAYIKNLDSKKPVLVCGDLNVAHKEIDLKNPKTNRMNAGFTDQEREKFQTLLDAGFIDTFRHFYPDMENIYSWWSYRFKAREKNAGWRIDYFVASARLADKLQGAKIHTEIFGSDHCPVEVTIDIEMKNDGFTLKKRLKSFKFAFNGIILLITREHNAWIHCFVAVCVIIAGFAFDISTTEWIAVTFAIGTVLAAEAVNSSIEAIADLVSPGYNEAIKRTKDLAAGAVLILAISAAIVGLIIFIPKIMEIFS